MVNGVFTKHLGLSIVELHGPGTTSVDYKKIKPAKQVRVRLVCGTVLRPVRNLYLCFHFVMAVMFRKLEAGTARTRKILPL